MLSFWFIGAGRINIKKKKTIAHLYSEIEEQKQAIEKTNVREPDDKDVDHAWCQKRKIDI